MPSGSGRNCRSGQLGEDIHREGTMTVERNPRTSQTCDCGCNSSIQITNTGDVNVYTCGTRPDHHECPPVGEVSTDPIAPGQCVPLAIGAKPKQSQRSKLDSLLAGSPVPSALAAGFVQTSRRFLAGRAPANAFEQEVFGVLGGCRRSCKGLCRARCGPSTRWPASNARTSSTHPCSPTWTP